MKYLSLFVFIFCFSFISIAQSHSYRTTALSFNFNGLNLDSYYGGIGGRFWISESTVLNANLGGSISERKYDETENRNNSLEKNKYLNIGIGMENHLSSADDLSPYFSSRLSFGINDRYYRSAFENGEQIEKTYSFNLDFGLGVEYWVLDRISLSGQHLFKVSYETGERSIDFSEVQNINAFRLYLGTTSIMVSIYF